jgi:hypothetical protein
MGDSRTETVAARDTFRCASLARRTDQASLHEDPDYAIRANVPAPAGRPWPAMPPSSPSQSPGPIRP